MTVSDKVKRRQLLPSMWACAKSFRSWLWKRYVTKFGTEPSEVQDRERMAYMFGWLSPEYPTLNEAWEEWATDPKRDHFEKNVLVEWARTDAQRATKALCFTTFAGTIGGFVLGASLIAFLWWLVG